MKFKKKLNIEKENPKDKFDIRRYIVKNTSEKSSRVIQHQLSTFLKNKRKKNVVIIGNEHEIIDKSIINYQTDFTKINMVDIDIHKYLKAHTGFKWDFIIFDNVLRRVRDDIKLLSNLRPGQKLIIIESNIEVTTSEEYLLDEKEVRKRYDNFLTIEEIKLTEINEKTKTLILLGQIKNKRLEYIRSIISIQKEGFNPPFIHPSAVICEGNVEIGERVVIMPNVVVGFPGIGAEWDENKKIIRFPQDGNVKIGDDVFISSAVVIDRAANKENLTEIGDRCVIGPMAHICHNVKIGHDTMILGNSIITGGARVGNHCMIGANATIRHKITVGNGVVVGMGAVVTKDVPDGVIVVGNPATILEEFETKKMKKDA
ncbi:MAG: DapH/DapD/GlmU-related protein [Candidatus Hermodarchaeota archaeon]